MNTSFYICILFFFRLFNRIPYTIWGKRTIYFTYLGVPFSIYGWNVKFMKIYYCRSDIIWMRILKTETEREREGFKGLKRKRKKKKLACALCLLFWKSNPPIISFFTDTFLLVYTFSVYRRIHDKYNNNKNLKILCTSLVYWRVVEIFISPSQFSLARAFHTR